MAEMGPLRVSADCTEELAEAVLSHPSLFARLLVLAALWVPVKCCYEHPLSGSCGYLETGETLKAWHLSVFTKWLSLSLRHQKADVSAFLAGDTERVYALRSLGEDAIPQAANEGERELFLQNLDIIQALILYEG